MNYLIANSPKFGKVLELTNEMFLNEIDKENKNVTVIVHIYDQVNILNHFINKIIYKKISKNNLENSRVQIDESML